MPETAIPFVPVLAFAALVFKFVDVLRFIEEREWKRVRIQCAAWAAGIIGTFLFALTDFADAIVIGGQTLADLSAMSKVVFGLGATSAVSALSDFRGRKVGDTNIRLDSAVIGALSSTSPTTNIEAPAPAPSPSAAPAPPEPDPRFGEERIVATPDVVETPAVTVVPRTEPPDVDERAAAHRRLARQNRPVLVEQARGHHIEVPDSWSRAEIADAILDARAAL